MPEREGKPKALDEVDCLDFLTACSRSLVSDGLVALAADDSTVLGGVQSALCVRDDVVLLGTVGLERYFVVELDSATSQWAVGDSIKLTVAYDFGVPLAVPGYLDPASPSGSADCHFFTRLAHSARMLRCVDVFLG